LIIDRFPFFSPLNDVEMDDLRTLFYEVRIKPGEKVGSKKGDVLYFVKDGFFQSEGVLQKSETVYLSQGSIIGSLPFSKDRIRGDVRAVCPSTLYAADIDSLYRFFMSNFPALRGYLRVVGRSGIPLSDRGNDLIAKSSRVISVCGHAKNSGKTVTSLFLAKQLSASGNVIICDMSSSGLSVFDYCRKKLIPPLAQKKEGDKGDAYFRERITEVEKGISLLNVSFGSNVTADASLVSPLLCYLSSMYEYIIFDIDGSDEFLEKEAVSVSDYVVGVCRNRREIAREKDRISRKLTEGQIFVLAGRESVFMNNDALTCSRIIIPEISFTDNEVSTDAIFGVADKCDVSVSILSERHDCHQFTTGGMNSLYYTGLIPLIGNQLKNGKIICAQSFAYALLSLFLCNEESTYLTKVRKLFREEKIESLIKYMYPGESLVKSDPLLVWASEISGMIRAEDIGSSLITSLADERGVMRITSAGLIRELIAASICEVPPCSYVKTSLGLRGSGRLMSVAYMLRHPVGKTISYSVRGSECEPANRRIKSALKFGFLKSQDRNEEKWLSDTNIIIDVNIKRFNIKGLVNDSSRLWEFALSTGS